MPQAHSQAALDAPSTFAEQVYRKVSWRLIPLLFICYIAAYLDRVNIGFAKLQMQGALQFSEAVYGLGAGIFFIGYFVLEVPSNVLLHRLGARKWIARIMISWGILSAAMVYVTSPLSFYVIRFLLGAAEAGFFPGIILYLTYWYPAERRGRATSLFMAAVACAGIFGGPLSGWILKGMNGVHGLAGWQWLFVLEGAPSVLLGILVLFGLQDRVQEAKWLSAEERALIARDIAAEETTRAPGSAWAVFANPRVWLLALVYFCFVSGLYGVSFWLPTIIKALGVADPLDVGLLSAIPWSFGVVAMYLMARSADRTGGRRGRRCGGSADQRRVPCRSDPVDGRPHPGDDGHHGDAAGLLGPADRLPGRHRGGGGHRAHQLVRKSLRLRRPLPDRADQGRDQVHRRRPAHARRVAVAGRPVRPGRQGGTRPRRRGAADRAQSDLTRVLAVPGAAGGAWSVCRVRSTACRPTRLARAA